MQVAAEEEAGKVAMRLARPRAAVVRVVPTELTVPTPAPIPVVVVAAAP